MKNCVKTHFFTAMAREPKAQNQESNKHAEAHAFEISRISCGQSFGFWRVNINTIMSHPANKNLSPVSTICKLERTKKLY